MLDGPRARRTAKVARTPLDSDEIKLLLSAGQQRLILRPAHQVTAYQHKMAVSAKASTFAVGTPVRQHTVARTQARRASRISAPVRAKYGDESQFFDLDDLENSAGSWDLYGTEDERRYPGLQAEFFQRAAAPLRRREALFGFVGVGWAAGIALWGANGSKWAKLPIQNGPKKGAVIGPRGRI